MTTATRPGGIGARLDRLADAFERHGVRVRETLLPGASPAEVAAIEAELGVVLPQAYRELYAWSAGPKDPKNAPFKFRDAALLRLADAVERREEYIDAYQMDAYSDDADPVEMNGIDLATTAPLAEFEGALYVVACGSHTLTPDAISPVIGVFQGIDIYFLSIESMLDTCIEWVEQEDWKQYSTAPNEHQVWHRHNPGVFGWTDTEP